MVKDMEDKAWELYDMNTDPTETKDLADQYPDRVNTMIDEYETWSKKVGVKKMAATKNAE